MSLRVLLADESASIRKVFQLGLQDYNAEVKSVHSGLDVIQVAEQFKPDIIFADILLQKKDGYQVSQEINDHPQLNNIPVILMWSSFMELDQEKYRNCQAQGEMEKPFEVDIMRSHIENYVDLTKDQQISQFLSFPQSINDEFIEEENAKADETPEENPSFENDTNTYEADEEPSIVVADSEESTSVFNLQNEDNSFEAELETEENSFQPIASQTETETEVPMTSFTQEETEDSWQTASLNDQTFDSTPSQEEDETDNFQSMELNASENLNLDDFLYKPQKEGLAPEAVKETQAPTLKTQDEAPSPLKTMSKSEIEAIVLAHTQEVIKINIQEQLPIIIEKVVREELEKLLQQELALKSANP